MESNDQLDDPAQEIDDLDNIDIDEIEKELENEQPNEDYQKKIDSEKQKLREEISNKTQIIEAKQKKINAELLVSLFFLEVWIYDAVCYRNI